MSKSRFDTEYLKWLQQLDVEEDDTVWEEIQNELDFIETWDYISGELDRINPPIRKITTKSYIKIVAAAAVAILLILASVNYFGEHVNQPPVHTEIIKTEEKLIENEINTTPEINKEQKTEDIVQKELLASAPATPVTPTTPVTPVTPVTPTTPATMSVRETTGYIAEVESVPFSEKEENKDTFERFEEYGITEIPDQQFRIQNLFAISIRDLSPGIITPDISLAGSSGSTGPFLSISDVGFSYSYKNTWLLNYETKNGLNPTKLGNTLLTFHQDLGILSTVAIRGQHFIGLEFLWRSGTGQKYQQYINASYVDRNIKLDYVKLQAYYIWDHRRIPGQTIIGGYTAKLKLAEDTRGKVTFNVNDEYRNLDYGLLLGYQFNIPLKNRIFISPGFRVTCDFINIYEGYAEAFNPFKKTNNIAAGINLSISYRLPQQ